MRERVKKYFSDFENAYLNLEDAVKIAKSDLEIDGVIKRFELCYELAWKLIKEYLADEGIICKSPRTCFKDAINNELIQNEDEWIQMIEDRNILVHSYTFAESRTIYINIKSTHINSLDFLYKKLKGAGE